MIDRTLFGYHNLEILVTSFQRLIRPWIRSQQAPTPRPRLVKEVEEEVAVTPPRTPGTWPSSPTTSRACCSRCRTGGSDNILVLGIPQSFKFLDEIVGRFQTMSDQIITRIDDMSAR